MLINYTVVKTETHREFLLLGTYIHGTVMFSLDPFLVSIQRLFYGDNN